MYNLLKVDETLSEENWRKLFNLKLQQKEIIHLHTLDFKEHKDDFLYYAVLQKGKKYARYMVVDNDLKCIGEFYSLISKGVFSDLGIYEDLGEVETVTSVYQKTEGRKWTTSH